MITQRIQTFRNIIFWHKDNKSLLKDVSVNIWPSLCYGDGTCISHCYSTQPNDPLQSYFIDGFLKGITLQLFFKQGRLGEDLILQINCNNIYVYVMQRLGDCLNYTIKLETLLFVRCRLPVIDLA